MTFDLILYPAEYLADMSTQRDPSLLIADEQFLCPFSDFCDVGNSLVLLLIPHATRNSREATVGLARKTLLCCKLNTSGVEETSYNFHVEGILQSIINKLHNIDQKKMTNDR